MSVLLFLTISLLFFFDDPVSAQTCQTKEQFINECTSKFGGVVDGASCFYSTGTGSPWSNANSKCNQQGGVLAQIHTDSELTKISSYLKSKWRTGIVWISLQRDDSILTNETCSYTRNTTYWHDNGVKNPSLTVGNTWLRTQTCVNPKDVGRNCLVIYDNDGRYNSFGDYTCDGGPVSLCQYRNAIQNFTLTTSPCLAETPIETFSATQPQDCADVCVQKMWCRSFNFGVNGSSTDCSNKICQLFSWSVNDVCTGACQRTFNATTSPFNTCFRYNYVQ